MKKFSIAVALIAALSATAANAVVMTGKVTSIATTGLGDNEDFYVKITPTLGTPASCATSPVGNIWFTTLEGAHPHTLQLLMAAYTTGKSVKVTGLNLCKNGAEILKDIVIQ
ncbi:hypothetical protein [Aquabacterium sp.]|uniref:hypothetical protein n=1 Tax=Aquabacterium sp. TaxID=1872578 RepID=UPI00248922BC|nr:hypothetical protein [Aquabacterium sp.]MDI1260971.1 hypothetical protein [Aquabacterium sp.]